MSQMSLGFTDTEMGNKWVDIGEVVGLWIKKQTKVVVNGGSCSCTITKIVFDQQSNRHNTTAINPTIGILIKRVDNKANAFHSLSGLTIEEILG